MKLVKSTKGLYQTCGIYGIQNIITNKWYIGSSIATKGGNRGVGGRIRRHLWELNQGHHHNYHLQSSWNKYGKDAFEFYVIEEVTNLEMIRLKEKEWMQKYKDQLYNISTETTHPGSLIWTEERRERQSGANHHMYGKTHTEEAKNKISINRQGLTAGINHHLYGIGHTEDTRKKMSESHKLLIGEKNPFYGKKHKEETKQINSQKKIEWLKENDHPGVFLPPKNQFKGVYTTNSKITASLKINGKLKYLGTFETYEEAAKNYDFYVKQIYPKGAYLNFPDFDYSDFKPKREINYD